MSPSKDVKYVTMSKDGNQGDREFVFACKGRPFVVLTAPNFPTPTTTLMDYNLVRDLNLRMSDLSSTMAVKNCEFWGKYRHQYSAFKVEQCQEICT